MYKMYVITRPGDGPDSSEYLSGSCKATQHWVDQIHEAYHFRHKSIAESVANDYNGTVQTIED